MEEEARGLVTLFLWCQRAARVSEGMFLVHALQFRAQMGVRQIGFQRCGQGFDVRRFWDKSNSTERRQPLNGKTTGHTGMDEHGNVRETRVLLEIAQEAGGGVAGKPKVGEYKRGPLEVFASVLLRCGDRALHVGARLSRRSHNADFACKSRFGDGATKQERVTVIVLNQQNYGAVRVVTVGKFQTTPFLASYPSHTESTRQVSALFPQLLSTSKWRSFPLWRQQLMFNQQ